MAALGILLPLGAARTAQEAGSIRGVVYDKDFEAPLAGAQVQAMGAEKSEKVTTSDQGNFVFRELPPGKYTLVFQKPGYVRQVRADVVVAAGRLTDVDAWLPGEFTDMEEYVVQDALQIGTSEAALLNLRFESPALMDSIGADLMSRAGASNAADAISLVAGATVTDGKFAVVRGLPDRYVNGQMNGVRLPTADENKRAVELDQFPAAVIESVQVSKTFTPDQQGDASGGAVNVVLKSIPEEDAVFQFRTQVGYNSQVADAGDHFLTYQGGGVNRWGIDDGDRDIQWSNVGSNWAGAVGTSEGEAPPIYKMSVAGGGKMDVGDEWTFGGYANLYYQRDAGYFDDGQNNLYWVDSQGGPMVPQKVQDQGSDDFKTALFDVTQGTESVQWGGLGTLGLRSENHYIGLTMLYTHGAQDQATLAENTRGKDYYFPGYDPDDPLDAGNQNSGASPYLRIQTLAYTERETSTFQLHGKHSLPDFLLFEGSELDWTAASNSASMNQPDKRQFGSKWLGPKFVPGFPPFTQDSVIPPTYLGYFPDATFSLGNLQRIYKSIEEEDLQFAVNLKMPFEQWSGDEGYVKLGVFDDSLERTFDQETFSNFGDQGSSFNAGWDTYWSDAFPYEDHPILEALTDIDYDGDQQITAGYGMADLPLGAGVSLIGGARYETTDISIVNIPEEEAYWFPLGAPTYTELMPGDADVSIDQGNLLPSIGLMYKPVDEVTLRLSYGQTIARPTFKELTPIVQQEYQGGPIFIGNPNLQLSSLENYDFRADYAPYAGGLVSTSLFYKSIEDPIENQQVVRPFSYTTAVNYPEGQISGLEFELRQNLGQYFDAVDGFSIGLNATWLQSEVQVPTDLQGEIMMAGFQPQTSRDMTGTPDHLYNVFLTYDFLDFGTRAALVYSVVGDTLVAGAGTAAGHYVPDVYQLQYDTLNLTLSQQLGRWFRVTFQAKNLTNPDIETAYRSDQGDVTRTSYTTGVDLALAISAQFNF